MTAEQGCEGRDEFTNGSPGDQWVGREGGGKGWVGDGACCRGRAGGREGLGVGGVVGLSRAGEVKLSAVQPALSLNLSALRFDVQIK